MGPKLHHIRKSSSRTDIARSSSKEEASFRSQVLVSNQGAFNGESRAEIELFHFQQKYCVGLQSAILNALDA